MHSAIGVHLNGSEVPHYKNMGSFLPHPKPDLDDKNERANSVNNAVAEVYAERWCKTMLGDALVEQPQQAEIFQLSLWPES